MKRTYRATFYLVALTGGLLLALLATGGTLQTTAPASGAVSDASMRGTISVLYSGDFMFNSKDLTDKWWGGVKQQFETKYPNAKLTLIPVPGNAADVATKAALLFRSPAQAPDVLEFNTAYASQFASAGYLRPLDPYLGTAPFWKEYPPNIQNLGRVNGKVYAVSVGNNISAIFYNKRMFAAAGLPVPWHPRDWHDILAAAKRIKQSVSGVIPLWLAAGNAGGPGVMLQGTANLLYGAPPATMFDAKTNKWVVDSPGIRATLGFYSSVYSAGLGASTSELFLPNAVAQPPVLLKDGKVAIAFGANWYPTIWVDKTNQGYWADAATVMAVTPIPTQRGQAPGFVSALGGWAAAVSSFSKDPAAAWALLRIMQEPENLLHVALWSGFVPPSTSVGKMREFVDYAPFMADFNGFAVYGRPLPANPNYPVYVQAVGAATGQMAKDPSTSIDEALKIIKDTMVQQLGTTSIETVP